MDDKTMHSILKSTARLLGIEGDSKVAARWSIQDLKPTFGFADAFTVKGRGGRVHCWQWAD